MTYNFTFLFRLKKMWGSKKAYQKSRFIHDGITEVYEPQPQTLKNIMAFADAYRCQKTETIGNAESMMN